MDLHASLSHWYIIVYTLNMKHIKTFPSTHRWCASELQLHQRQPRLHCILDHSTTAIISCLWCGLHQHLWIFVARNLMCEVFAYIFGASLSEPLLVRSTPALSVYIYIYLYILSCIVRPSPSEGACVRFKFKSGTWGLHRVYIGR